MYNSEKLSHLRQHFELLGYVIIRLENSDDLLDEINADIASVLEIGSFKTNSKIFSYNRSPRIVEAWRTSKAVKQLVFHPLIIDLLESLFGDEPRPFSTINFSHSTEQPFHSDAVHFPTIPENRLAAAWVALEDIDLRSGPLQVIPGSHKMSTFTYSEIGGSNPKSLSDVGDLYHRYEDWVVGSIGTKRLTPTVPRLSKGDCLIWDSNLLHGSPECVDNSLTRRSQVTHYHFGYETRYYSLAFSDPASGKFVPRMVSFIERNEKGDV